MGVAAPVVIKVASARTAYVLTPAPSCLQPATTGLPESSGGGSAQTVTSATAPAKTRLELLKNWKKKGKKIRKKSPTGDLAKNVKMAFLKEGQVD